MRGNDKVNVGGHLALYFSRITAVIARSGATWRSRVAAFALHPLDRFAYARDDEAFCKGPKCAKSSISYTCHKTSDMCTNIEIEDELMDEALKLTGLPTKRAVVEEGLRLMVRLRKQARALKALKGLGWQGDLNEMRKLTSVAGDGDTVAALNEAEVEALRAKQSLRRSQPSCPRKRASRRFRSGRGFPLARE